MKTEKIITSLSTQILKISEKNITYLCLSPISEKIWVWSDPYEGPMINASVLWRQVAVESFLLSIAMCGRVTEL